MDYLIAKSCSEIERENRPLRLIYMYVQFRIKPASLLIKQNNYVLITGQLNVKSDAEIRCVNEP